MALLEAITRATRAFAERRASFRRATNCRALIEFGDPAHKRSCTIVDMSNGGARIAVASSHDLPEEFSLILAVGGGGTITRRVRIAWCTDAEVGVRYLIPAA